MNGSPPVTTTTTTSTSSRRTVSPPPPRPPLWPTAPPFYPRLDPYHNNQLLAAAAGLSSPNTTTTPLSPFGGNQPLPHPFMGSAYGQLYPSVSNASYAAAMLGPRPPYIDAATFLQMSSSPRYRYLISSMAARFGGASGPMLPSPSLNMASERSHSASEAAAANRAAAGAWTSSPNSMPPPASPPLVSPTQALPPSRASSFSTSGPLRHTSQPYYPSHFMRGTVIQLANGELKRVEQLNTEDFVRSANLCADLKMDSSTVVKIEEKTKDFVLLCFSVGEQKVQVSVEATVEHPFFVIGQGWSSCSPDRARTLYGLPCQRLQVGDICISLTHRPSADSTGQSTSSSGVRPSSTTTNNIDGKRVTKKRTYDGRKSLPPVALLGKTAKRQRRWSLS